MRKRIDIWCDAETDTAIIYVLEVLLDIRDILKLQTSLLGGIDKTTLEETLST